jgi:hypothetical protein
MKFLPKIPQRITGIELQCELLVSGKVHRQQPTSNVQPTFARLRRGRRSTSNAQFKRSAES